MNAVSLLMPAQAQSYDEGPGAIIMIVYLAVMVAVVAGGIGSPKRGRECRGLGGERAEGSVRGGRIDLSRPRARALPVAGFLP